MNRPAVLPTLTFKHKFHCREEGEPFNFYLSISTPPDELRKPIEVFIHVGKGGDCRRTAFNGFAGILSKALQAGMPVNEAILFLKGMGCLAQEINGPASCMDWIADKLKEVEQGEHNV